MSQKSLNFVTLHCIGRIVFLCMRFPSAILILTCGDFSGISKLTFDDYE